MKFVDYGQSLCNHYTTSNLCSFSYFCGTISFVKQFIIKILDLLYPLFQRYMTKQTFRYVVCGGGNTLLDIFIYFISYNFILQKQVVQTPVAAISPYIASFIIAFCFSFPIGYLLNRYIVFPGSSLKGRVQLLRYFMLVLVCILLNYVFIKFFVEQLNIYPTISKILTTVIVVCFSYVTQKYYTFSNKESHGVVGKKED